MTATNKNKSNNIEIEVDNNSNNNNTPSSPTSTATSPRYFAAHQYEYEVSPEQVTMKVLTTTRHVVTETSLPMTKTVYLIRHAESDENRRQACLKSSVKGLGKLKLPKREDVVASMELMNVGAQLDSCVSPRGQAQIDQLGRRIAKDNFVHNMGIQLVAHSPLQRARQTCYGMLQCVAPSSSLSKTNEDDSNDPLIIGSKHPSVSRVVELDFLSERTPIEWLPIQHDAFTKRIAEFEMWLSQQPEEVIAIVGHSQYFKDMLGLESKFHNVDVWSLQFDFTIENSVERVKEDVHVANESEKKKKIQKQIEKFGNMIQKTNLKRRNKNENTETMGEISDDEYVPESPCGGYENRDEHDTPTEKSNITGVQTEFDGISLEELDLPRGWRQLKHHYRFDASYSE